MYSKKIIIDETLKKNTNYSKILLYWLKLFINKNKN